MSEWKKVTCEDRAFGRRELKQPVLKRGWSMVCFYKHVIKRGLKKNGYTQKTQGLAVGAKRRVFGSRGTG